MTCASCALRVERVLSRQPEVDNATVNFATGTAVVSLSDPSSLRTFASGAADRLRPPCRDG